MLQKKYACIGEDEERLSSSVGWDSVQSTSGICEFRKSIVYIHKFKGRPWGYP